LASMLDKGNPVPSVLLIPLDARRSKAEFIECYGLVPSYGIFLQEIREGRILPYITEKPTHYKADFQDRPPFGFDALRAYDAYLLYGYSMGLGGLRMYDRVDLEVMTFLRGEGGSVT
ncbi:MAG: hypothetical protein LM590_14480, partial [Thermofilum sp.]|nr:hypothetical protein [Thermofilum sp.]